MAYIKLTNCCHSKQWLLINGSYGGVRIVQNLINLAALTRVWLRKEITSTKSVSLTMAYTLRSEIKPSTKLRRPKLSHTLIKPQCS